MSWTLRADSRVELVVHGPAHPARPVAVVLHGVGSTADFALRCLAKPLTDLGYDVVAPDLRGHAGSTPLSDP
ncbi:MAG TPA: alpha/beta fold hydrolase, partial [Mycobacteriales bacterium]|nr:alpha/beta fold hydrolase [Mycobacteriales bacterium]